MFIKNRLKLKEIKCNFLKRHIQYLGHLMFETGIEPLPEKLNSLQDMPQTCLPLEIQMKSSNFWVWPVTIGNLYQDLLTFHNP